jgi:hypothetical protein
MSHRLCAVLVMTSFALEGAGCAWMKQGPTGEQVSMPLRTGSNLHRTVMVPKKSNAASSASQKKKDSKKKAKKEATKHSTPTPTPAPVKSKPKSKAKPTHEPHPDEMIPNAPDRLR